MRGAIKSLVFLLALVPLGWLAFAVLTGRSGPNPAEDIHLTTGIWALRFLLLTLAITPLRRLTGWNRLIQYRRMLGLFAFFYACLHVLGYLAFDQLFAFDRVLADIVERPFIAAGMLGFAAMIPLAVTSTKGWIRRLGRRWALLHRLVYLSAAAACLHFAWKVKVVIGEPVYYALILGILLLARVLVRLRRAGGVERQPARA